MTTYMKGIGLRLIVKLLGLKGDAYEVVMVHFRDSNSDQVDWGRQVLARCTLNRLVSWSI